MAFFVISETIPLLTSQDTLVHIPIVQIIAIRGFLLTEFDLQQKKLACFSKTRSLMQDSKNKLKRKMNKRNKRVCVQW